MKKINPRFEVVPVSEVLEKAVEVESANNVERAAGKEEPYAVPIHTENSPPSRKLPRHRKYKGQ